MDHDNMSGLIEGLPDEVALTCLARVPFSYHRNLQLVCRSWRAALCSPEVFKIRCEAGVSEELLCVIPCNPGNVWQLYDPCRDHWLTLTVLPSRFRNIFLYGVASVAGKLFVLGGMIGKLMLHNIFATDEVWSYDPFCREWSRRANMLVPRANFACCSLDGKIVVAGGHTTSGDAILKAEIYDPNTDTWRPLPDLSHAHTSTCSCVVIGGKIHVFHEDLPVFQILEDGRRWSVDHSGVRLGFPMAVVREECYFVNTAGYVMKICKEGSRGNGFKYRLVSRVPDFKRRVTFGLIGVGDDLYVIGGVRLRLRDGLLRDVSILSVNGDSPTWRRVSTMIGSGRIIPECALLKV